jgi:hypothetical protein
MGKVDAQISVDKAGHLCTCEGGSRVVRVKECRFCEYEHKDYLNKVAPGEVWCPHCAQRLRWWLEKH